MLMIIGPRIAVMTVGVLLSMVAGNFAQGRSTNGPGCALIDKHHPSQFIFYEGRSESSPEIKLRLRNNTDCAIIVETDDVLPTQEKKRHSGALRIEPVTGSEEGIKLRLHYLVQDGKRQTAPKPAYGWGDSVFTYQILAGQSVIFTVPVSHFRQGFDIAVPFNYSWEGGNSIGMGTGGVVHRVYFMGEDLPKAMLRTGR